MSNAPKPIPSALCGDHKEVRKMWRAVVRRAVKSRSWDAALAAESMVSVDDAPGGLVLGGPDRAVQGRHVMLYAVMRELEDVSYLGYERGHESNELREVLIRDGMERFWFCLGVLGNASLWMIMTDEFNARRHELAAFALERLLRWWPEFMRLDGRFLTFADSAGSWPSWGHRAFSLCADLGVPEDELRPVRVGALDGKIDALRAAEQISHWLHTYGGMD